MAGADNLFVKCKACMHIMRVPRTQVGNAVSCPNCLSLFRLAPGRFDDKTYRLIPLIPAETSAGPRTGQSSGLAHQLDARQPIDSAAALLSATAPSRTGPLASGASGVASPPSSKNVASSNTAASSSTDAGPLAAKVIIPASTSRLFDADSLMANSLPQVPSSGRHASGAHAASSETLLSDGSTMDGIAMRLAPKANLSDSVLQYVLRTDDPTNEPDQPYCG